MFDLGWFELAIVAALLLVVVGPKDLPKVLRTVGVWTGKVRRLAREFQRTLDDYAKESELDDVAKAVKNPNSMQESVRNTVDPTGAIADDLKKTDETLRSDFEDIREGASAKPDTSDVKTDETKNESQTASPGQPA